MPLRRLYVVVLAAFAVVFTATSSWLALSVTSRAFEAELNDKLLVTAGVAAETRFEASDVSFLSPGDEESPYWAQYQDRLQRLVERRYVDAAWIFRNDSSVVAGATPVHTVIVSTADAQLIGTRIRRFEAYGPQLTELWRDGAATTPLFAGEDGRSYKYGFARLEDSDLALAVLIPADYLAPLARLERTVLIGSGLTIVLSILVAVGLAARIAEPLERLSRVALRIQRGRISQPVEVEAGVEIGRLSRAMERMRQGIIQRDEHLRLMLAQVAHEIRNPLGGLKLFAAVAAESTEAEERGRLFQRIQAEVDVLNRIITDFLIYARPRSPQAKLHDIRSPLREAAELVATELESGGGKLEIDLPETALEAVADPGQVKRMVLNLLRNAADAGDRVWLKGEWRNGEVVVSVRDNGPGVPESMRTRIFEPFVTSKEQGAGLGLAIVGGVARANDARVELVQGLGSVGSGAEFRLYLSGSEEFPVTRAGAHAH